MNSCIVGLQWGDEGKGKVIDILAEQSDIVVRYNGGANAGHTVVIDGNKFALHLLPSGSIRPNIVCVITNAVVVDPDTLLQEIETLAQKGITLKGRLFISENAHVVLDYHKKEDKLREESLGKDKIGTTIRGIGPCYADKVGRSYAVRMGDLRDLKKLKAHLQTIIEYKNKVFTALYNAEPISADEIFEKCKAHADKLTPFITDTTEFLHKSIADGKSILFEGAQGSMLDLDHGTFPYVTSSNSSALGMSVCSGVPAKMVDKFIGVVKAYTTRVGAGPFPTELDNEVGQYIRDKGHEYGTTTGRPRRCGWFDAVVVSYAATIGAIDSIALMHLDTLTGLKEINICRAYKINGKETTFFPANIDRLSQATPIYETVPGWDIALGEVTDFDNLPANAKNFIRLIEEIVKVPITMIGIGPERKQTIFR
ncbi:MAG: adenylosuccinate synthase [Phycisphaerae bacterium]|nr:adenylosuccinate synthase [Phycisphaerae bacterium]MDD5380602.1 adenylosuccinate synthase [Phycisphaerae bacterium]